jgi:hypothetical protein
LNKNTKFYSLRKRNKQGKLYNKQAYKLDSIVRPEHIVEQPKKAGHSLSQEDKVKNLPGSYNLEDKNECKSSKDRKVF